VLGPAVGRNVDEQTWPVEVEVATEVEPANAGLPEPVASNLHNSVAHDDRNPFRTPWMASSVEIVEYLEGSRAVNE
jgi:hypothetical protein